MKLMNMNKIFVFVFFLICEINGGHSQYYSIIAPRVISPADTHFNFSVTLSSSSPECTMSVGIINKGKIGERTSTFQNITVFPNLSNLVSMPLNLIDINEDAKYKFQAEGLSGIFFPPESLIVLVRPRLLIFIQTDKERYMPMDTIRFRVLTLDWNLRPALPVGYELNIKIYKTVSVMHKQWNINLPTGGVYSSEYKLDSFIDPDKSPYLYIVAEVAGNKFEKVVEIQDSPKLTVTVNSLKNFKSNDLIWATIQAQYSDRKTVDGSATVSIYQRTGEETYKLTPLASKIAALHPSTGMATVKFNISNKIDQYVSQHKLVIEAIIEDKFKKENEIQVIPITVFGRNIDPYLLISVNPKRPTIFERVSVHVQFNEKVHFVHYLIVNGGKIIEAKTLEIPSTYNGTFEFFTIPPMAPKSDLIVYWKATSSPEMQSRNIEIEFEPPVSEHLQLELPKEVKPGETINVTIKSSSNSLVWLHATKNDVNSEGSDIIKNKIYEQLREVTKFSDEYYAAKYFYNSGLNILTNALRYTVSGTHLEKQVLYKGFQPIVKIRQNFIETWLWDSFMPLNGELVVQAKVPDDITTWKISGFHFDSIGIFAITKKESLLRVTLPFYISTKLPFSVKRNELISVPVKIFNNHDRELTVEVTLDNTDRLFEFETGDKTNEKPLQTTFLRKRTNVMSHNTSLLFFLVRPKRIADARIKITATGPGVGDRVEWPLVIEPEGIPQYNEEIVILDLTKNDRIYRHVTIELPKAKIVPHSTKIEISIQTNILQYSLPNIETFMARENIYKVTDSNYMNVLVSHAAFNYIKRVHQLKAHVTAYATPPSNLMGLYYYKGTKSLSTWMIALTLSILSLQKKNDTSIDSSFLSILLNELKRNQDKDGSFREANPDGTENIGSNVALTAFTLIATLDIIDNLRFHELDTKSAEHYVSGNLNKLDPDDIRALALSALALQKANSSYRMYAKQLLDDRVRTNGQRKWWVDKNKPSVETTAYGLLTYLEYGDLSGSVPIVKWLIEQWDEESGFSSENSFIIAIIALSNFHEKTSFLKDQRLELILTYEKYQKAFTLTGSTATDYQTYQFPIFNQDFGISGTGNGFAIVQFSYKYNLYELESSDSPFLLELNSTSNHPRILDIAICVSYNPPGVTATEKSFITAIMEIHLPSGFAFDLDSLLVLELSKNIKKVETKNDDTLLVVLFDNLGQLKECASLKAISISVVAERKSASAIIYENYNRTRRSVTFYEVNTTESSCDTCDADDEKCFEFCIMVEKEEDEEITPEIETKTTNILNKDYVNGSIFRDQTKFTDKESYRAETANTNLQHSSTSVDLGKNSIITAPSNLLLNICHDKDKPGTQEITTGSFLIGILSKTYFEEQQNTNSPIEIKEMTDDINLNKFPIKITNSGNINLIFCSSCPIYNYIYKTSNVSNDTKINQQL